jgi:hypothetical protein
MRSILLIAVCLSLPGCAAVATGLVSVGAGFGVGHHLSGTTYRTFTEPLLRVENAARTALKRMAINVESSEKTKSGELLKASVGDRRIEVELEALTPNATRMRSVAIYRSGLVLDAATGQEIVAQTEKVLQR